MIDIGKLRSAYSGLRRSNRRCASLPEEGGESSGDYKVRHDENPESGRRVKFG
jgi:hypothetical protein